MERPKILDDPKVMADFKARKTQLDAALARHEKRLREDPEYRKSFETAVKRMHDDENTNDVNN